MSKKYFLCMCTCICLIVTLADMPIGSAQELQLKIFKLRSSDTKRIYAVIEPLKSAQGKITFDEATQSIIVYDTQEGIQRVQGVIQELDIPARQIQIEVTTIKSTQQTLDSLGITGLHKIIAGPRFLSILHASAGNSRSSEKIHAQTKITTLENQKASIELAEDVVVGQETTVVHPDFVTTTPLRSSIGQTLEVIAMVNADNTISLNVEPSLRTMNRGNIEDGSISTHITVNEGDAIVIGMCDTKHSGSRDSDFFGLPASHEKSNENIKLVTFISAKVTR